MFFREVCNKLLYISSVWVDNELPLGECSRGRFRTCSNEVVKFTVQTAQILATPCCALLVVLARRRDTHMQTLASIVRQAHLPNSSVEKCLCVSHLHMQNFYVPSFMLCRSAEERSLYCSYSGATPSCKCLPQAYTLMQMLKSVL